MIDISSNLIINKFDILTNIGRSIGACGHIYAVLILTLARIRDTGMCAQSSNGMHVK